MIFLILHKDMFMLLKDGRYIQKAQIRIIK